MRKIVFTGFVLGTAIVLSGGTAGAQGTASDYPPCSRGMTDKCTQTNEGHHAMMGDHGMMGHHGGWHHHMRHHMHHHMMMRHGHHHMSRHHHAKHHDDDKK